MALEQARVIREDRALRLRQLRQRGVAPSPAVCGIVEAQCDAREEQMAHGGARGERRRLEDREGGHAKTAGFEQAPFVHEENRLVEIDQRRPHVVLLADHPRASRREDLEGLEGLALLAV